MGHIVIVGYRPKPGKAEALRNLLSTHVPRLRAEGLVTDREPILMRASDGTFVEVFEWKSHGIVQTAHTSPVIQAMWKEYAEVCEYVPVGSLAEAQQLFSGFGAVGID